MWGAGIAGWGPEVGRQDAGKSVHVGVGGRYKYGGSQAQAWRKQRQGSDASLPCHCFPSNGRMTLRLPPHQVDSIHGKL